MSKAASVISPTLQRIHARGRLRASVSQGIRADEHVLDPDAGVMVSALLSQYTPFEIFGILFALAVVFAVVLIGLGRRHFGYASWLPSSDPCTYRKAG